MKITMIKKIIPNGFDLISDGTYRGRWGGYTITLNIDSNIYELVTKKGVKGTNVPVIVTVNSNSVTFEVAKEKINNEQLFNVLLIFSRRLGDPKYAQQRRGQLLFNIVHDIHPEIANKYRGTIIDPFHNNANIPKFLEQIAK